MATNPAPEMPPSPAEPAQPTAPPPEVGPIAPDIDIPSPQTENPGIAPGQPSAEDERSDIQQVVEARKDAVERGEGGDEIDAFISLGEHDGVGGTGGVVKNQDDMAQ